MEKQCVRRGGVALMKARQELQRQWRTLDDLPRHLVSRALVYTEAALQRGNCRAARSQLGFARQVLKRGAAVRLRGRLLAQRPAYRFDPL